MSSLKLLAELSDINIYLSLLRNSVDTDSVVFSVFYVNLTRNMYLDF